MSTDREFAEKVLEGCFPPTSWEITLIRYHRSKGTSSAASRDEHPVVRD